MNLGQAASDQTVHVQLSSTFVAKGKLFNLLAVLLTVKWRHSYLQDTL